MADYGKWSMALLVAGLAAHSAPGESTYAAWQAWHAQVLRDPTVLRCYTFEDVVGPGQPVANQAGAAGALTWQLLDAKDAEPETLAPIVGRWPGKKAVRLDRGILRGEPFAIENQQVSIECWVRKNGPGTLPGNPGTSNGTLLSVGVGYWDGWRLTCGYPGQHLGFELGRPQPSSAFGIRTGPVSDGVWHHVVATWDGRESRLYVDGRLAGRGAYAGAYTPTKPDAQFRIGYAGFGIGSAKLDFDEVIIRRRALSALEVMQAAWFHIPFTGAVAERLQAIVAANEGSDRAATEAAYGALAELAEAPADLRADARLQRALLWRDSGRAADARAELVALVRDPALPAGAATGALVALAQLSRAAGEAVPAAVLRRLLGEVPLDEAARRDLELNLARSLRAEGDLAGARAQLERLLAAPELADRARLNLRLELGHLGMVAKTFSAARAEYAQVASDPASPAHFRALARLRVADTWLRERNATAAATELRGLAADPAAPPHLRDEATERLAELERVAKGQPARDPAVSRTVLAPLPQPAVELFVAPGGDDAGPGTAARPFASLTRARDAVRALRARVPLPAGGVAVTIADGVYPVRETIALTAADTGTAAAPVVFRAAAGARPRFTGGAPLQGFEPVTDAAILARLPEEARGQVLQADVRRLGLGDLANATGPASEVFFNGQPLQPARWPNEGFLKTGAIVDAGQAGQRGATFGFDQQRAARWTAAKDIWLYGYWRHLWADARLPVARIDLASQQIHTASITGYGLAANMPFYVYNLLEEIDQPGEWYLDRASGLLYLWPPADPAGADVQLSCLAGPLVTIEGASHLTLSGLTFELGRGDGVVIRGGERCRVVGCTVRYLGGTALTVEGGTGHTLLGCDLYQLGRGGTRVIGGDRTTLTPGEHVVENCHIHDLSRIGRTYTPAVFLDGCGNRVAHNLFRESPCHGMRIEGNDHVIEYNEVHSVVWESDDQGGVDMWFNPTYRGNVFRYNFWHHIGSGLDVAGQAGIRLDDAISGTLIYGNVFYKCSSGNFGGVQIHGGKDNLIDNNLFVGCKWAVSFSGWGQQRWLEFLDRADTKKAIDAVKALQPPYLTRYPELARLREGEGISSIWRAVAVDCGGLLTRDRGIQDVADNLVTGRDPGFADRDRLNFALRADSPVYDESGFRPIPFAEIGLYRDEHRASWPVENPVTTKYRIK